MRSILFLLISSLCCRAAVLHGLVTAKDRGIALPDARVTASAGAMHKSAVSDREGRFSLGDLPDGTTLHVTVELTGFVTAQMDVAPTSEVTVTLALADVKETVVVSEGLLSVRSDAPENSQTITADQLEDLPSNGRRLMRFALLDPHVRPAIGLGSDGPDSNRLSINANSYRHTAYMLDGSVNYDWVYAVSPQQSVSTGAVEQLKVLSGQYAAEFGTSTAGVLVATTKSGSNSLHGEAIGFVRPGGIQAQAPLAAGSLPHIPNERFQWGASVGGPIQRDKSFFFLNYEGAHQERGAYIQSPTPSFFTGKIDEQYALAKIDYRWSDREWLSWRANGSLFSGNNLNDRVAGFNQPSYGRETRNQSLGSQATLHSLFEPFFNELRLSFAGYTPDSAFPLSPSVGIARPSYSTEGFSTNNWVHTQTYNAGDVLAWRTGAHSWKAGATYSRQFVKDYSYTPFGTYTFAAGPPVPGQTPLRFSQTFGAADFQYGQTVTSAFVQDDIRWSPRLTLNLGLRYEYQSVTHDKNNFAPRLGLAWDVTGDGKTRVRAGAGMFYDQFYLYIYRRFYSLDPYAPTSTYTIPFGDPEFPTFPNSLTSPPTGVSSGRKDLFLPAANIVNPYSLQFTLGVQRQLGKGFLFTVDGLHSHVLRQMRVNDINHPAPFLRTAAGQVRTAAQADLSRPYQTYLGVPVRLIAVIENSSSSIYDALTFGLSRRAGRRTQLDLHYAIASSATYSMFYADANSGIPNEWNNLGSAERAPSDFHQRHRVVGSGTVELPLDFRLSVAAVVASGLPINPLTGTDNNGDTYSSDRPVGFGRNSFRTPVQAQFDVAGVRRFRLTERLSADLRVEVFNLLNRNNLINVTNTYGEGPAPGPNFGKPIAGVTNTDPSRQIQFGVRLSF